MPAEPMAEPPVPADGMNDMPPMDNGPMMGDGGNPYDTDFDAGVEADEETDPKKYIQQLTGKLSQSLRSYNENLPQPDADLDKYVAGMIVKQAVEGLSLEDRNDILNKINSDDEGDMPQGDMEQNDVPQDDENGGQMPPDNMGESFSRERRKKIDEIFNQVMNGNNDDEDEGYNEIKGKFSYKRKPFVSPEFKDK